MYPSWAAQRRFSSDSGALGTWKDLKKCHTVDEFLGFRNFTRAHQKRFQRAPKSDPREAKMGPRSGPGAPPVAPGAPRPKTRQERPKRTQEPPKLGFRAALTAHLSPKSFPEASRRPSWALPVAIFHPPEANIYTPFHLPGSICKTVLCSKLMQAYGQHRSTSLCNFCMLISTATDSRSRSTNQCIAA